MLSHCCKNVYVVYLLFNSFRVAYNISQQTPDYDPGLTKFNPFGVEPTLSNPS